MEKNKIKVRFPSELRYDVVSKDWVVIATGRGKRPEAFKKRRKPGEKVSEKKCPFCQVGPKEPPLLIYINGKRVFSQRHQTEGSQKLKKMPKGWSTVVIPNKYPALLPSSSLGKKKEGRFYQRMKGVGYCELVIPRGHKQDFYQLSVSRIREIFDAYQQRYLSLKKRKFVSYISIFHNHGPEAGASQPHPHSQIITTPLIDSDLRKALSNSQRYYQENKKCIYCQMNKWDQKVKKRIVFENKHFLVLCPFASKMAFQVIISPKEHSAFFEKIDEEKKSYLAEAFKMAMTALAKGLSKPAYNFYLHTAPCDKEDYFYYHWHWTILPKTATPAGFEIGTRMEISTIEPEKAADYLRKQLS